MEAQFDNLFGRGEEAMLLGASQESSHDLAGVVDPLARGSPPAGHVERGVAPIHIQQEAMTIANSDTVRSNDLAGAVDPMGTCTGRAGNVERGVGAIHIQKEAVVRATARIVT